MAGSSVLHMLVADPRIPVPFECYADRMADALRRAGRAVTIHRLRAPRGQVDRCAVLAADIALARLPDGAAVLLDIGLLPCLAAAVALDSRRLSLTALFDRTEDGDDGLTPDQVEARRNLDRGTLAQMRRIAVPEQAAVAGLLALGLPGDRIVVAPADAGGVLRLLEPAVRPQAALCHNA